MTEQLFGFGRRRADRLVEVADEPRQVNSARTEPLRKPQFVGSGGGWVITPTGGIPAASFTSPDWTLGSASCNEAETFDDGGTIKMRAVSPHVSITVYSHSQSIIPGDIPIRYSVLGGYNIAHVPGVVDLRIDGPNKKFEKTVDGSTWVDWHTGTGCS